MFVNNQARTQAFKMAALSYDRFKDDPVKAQKYQDMMDNIMPWGTDNSGNSGNGMPSLPM